MINDSTPRLEFNRRVKYILNELDRLYQSRMHLLPIEQVNVFHKITEEFRAFVKVNEHNHD